MMRSSLHVAALFVFAAICVVASTPARATTLLRMPLDKLSRTSTLIVRARCTENWTGWDAGEIWTFTSFELEESWRGSPPARIVVRLLGGRTGNLTSTVSGVPRFSSGEDVVLFLEPTQRGDFSVVGWQQGTFRIRPDRHSGEGNVTQDSASFATFNPATRRFETEGIERMPLRDFRARVAELVQLATRSKQ